jgi:hypothetical protein
MTLDTATMINALRQRAEQKRAEAADLTATTETGIVIMLPEAVIKHRIAALADQIATDIEELSRG